MHFHVLFSMNLHESSSWMAMNLQENPYDLKDFYVQQGNLCFMEIWGRTLHIYGPFLRGWCQSDSFDGNPLHGVRLRAQQILISPPAFTERKRFESIEALVLKKDLMRGRKWRGSRRGVPCEPKFRRTRLACPSLVHRSVASSNLTLEFVYVVQSTYI